MDTPTISVIMPCFNYARFLRDAVNSLIGGPTCLGEFAPQTFQNFDIWIVNDASTDDTDAVAQSLVGDRIKYISNQTNLGTAATLNVGIRQSAGKYITFLSADDMMETTRLEKLYQTCLSNSHRIAYDDIRIFDGKARTDTWPMSEYDFDKILYKNSLHAGIMYPRQAWDECGGYPEIMNDGREDWAFGVALGMRGWCGVRVREPLYLYRREGQNRSLKTTGGQWRMTFLGKMQSLYPALYRGERPTMCCGNSNKRTIQKAALKNTGAQGGAALSRSRSTFNIGEDGMVHIEYQLPKAGNITYKGVVTGQEYAFSSIRKRGYVDARDAAAFLSRIEDRRHAFLLVDEPTPNIVPAPIVETAPVPVPTPMATEELVITETVPQTLKRLPVSEHPPAISSYMNHVKPRKPRKSV